MSIGSAMARRWAEMEHVGDDERERAMGKKAVLRGAPGRWKWRQVTAEGMAKWVGPYPEAHMAAKAWFTQNSHLRCARQFRFNRNDAEAYMP